MVCKKFTQVHANAILLKVYQIKNRDHQMKETENEVSTKVQNDWLGWLLWSLQFQ